MHPGRRPDYPLRCTNAGIRPRPGLTSVWSLMRVFVQRNPHALALATSELAGPLAGWWRRRRVRRDAHRVGVTALLERPLQPRQISEWLELI